MLDIISYTHDAIQEVKSLQANEGGGNFLLGLGRALGTAIEGAASGSSKIIKSIGGAIKNVLDGAGDLDEKVVGSIGDATSKVITSTGGAIEHARTGLGNVFHGFFGGIGGTIKWIIVLLLIIALIYMNWKRIRRTLCRQEKLDETIDTFSEYSISLNPRKGIKKGQSHPRHVPSDI